MKSSPNKMENLSKIIKKKHHGKWIAVSSDYKKVVDFSADLVSLTKKNGTRDIVYMRPVPQGMTLAL